MVREYIGARYVPKFMGTHDLTQIYEALCVVDNGLGTSYISKIPTPAGTPLTDTTYWTVYGASSGAVINLQNQIDLIHEAFVIPEMFGAVGDGVTDDTQAIQDAIDAGVNNVVFLPKTYKIVTLSIKNKDGFKLIGSGATLKTTATTYAIQMEGTINDVIIEGFNITADNATSSTNICGIGSNSGNSLTRLRIFNNNIYNMNVGISVNSDLSGHVEGCIVYGNFIRDMLGTEIGQGYGIHMSDGADENASSIIDSNTIDNCSRHAIYLARGRGYNIINNRILNHRKDVATGSLRPAIDIARTSDVVVKGNILDGYSDGAIAITGEASSSGYPLASYPADNIIISENIFMNQKNAVGISIGHLSQASTGISENVIIDGNVFSNESVKNGIDLHYAKNLRISNNSFKNSYMMLGSSNMGASDNIDISHNLFDCDSSVEPIEILSNWGTANITTLFAFNSKIGGGNMFDSHVIVTNDSVSFVGTDKSGYSTTATFKQIYVNSTAM